MIGRGLDVVCWAISTTTLLASLNAHDSSAPFASCSSIFVSPSSLSLSSPEGEGLPQCVHLLAQQTWNYNSSWIHSCSQFSSQTLHTQEG